MDAVVVFGGGNDGAATTGELVTAANAAWTATKDAQPDAPLIVVGFEATAPNETIDGLNNALKAAADEHPAVHAFVDLRYSSFITGTGHVGAPVGDGNADVFINADNTHPSHAGGRWWGENLARILGTVLVSSGQ
jgi:lysophospholipase L1-like esterase